MTPRQVTLILTTAAILLVSGCQRGQGSPRSGRLESADDWVVELQHADPLKRIQAAQALAKLPTAELQKVVPDLKQARAKERDRAVREKIQRALDVAGGSTAH